MKVYIGNQQVSDESYRSITDPTILNYIAEDSECSVIVLNGVLRKYNLNTSMQILELCYKKLRIGGLLKIIDIDFDLLIYAYQRNGNLVALNNGIFDSEMRSFLTLEFLKDFINQNFRDLGPAVASRVQNIEFDVEFTRK